MAYRTWGRVLLAALVVGLLAGAGQLGFAYGLGVVRFSRDFEQLSGQWTAHLAWVAWFAMLAAVAGGLAGDWLARRAGLPATIAERVAVAVAGGVGALAVAPLAMLPARAATTGDGNPVAIAGLSAALGALVGVFAALAVLSQRVAGLNLGAVTVVIWLIALLSVAPSLGPDDPLPEVRLGVLDATWLGDSLAQRLAVIVMPAIALAVGAGIGAVARWRGLPMIPVAVSGVVGPALLALAYLIAGPGNDADRYQAAPYWGALISVAAGGLGSVLASVARQLTAGGGTAAPAGPGPRHGDHTAEVFPSYGSSGSDPLVAGTASTESSAGEKKPADPTRPGDPLGSWGGDDPSSSFGREPDKDLFGNPRHEQRGSGSADHFGDSGGDPLGTAGSGGSFSGFGSDGRDRLGGSGFGGGGRDPLGSAEGDASFTGLGGGEREPLGGAGTGGSVGDRDPLGTAGGGGSGARRGRSGDDPLGGSGLRSEGVPEPRDESAARRARDLSDMERSTTPRVGDGQSPSGPVGASVFNPPTPVAPPRRPEVVSPPPGPEPTPIRPFERQSAAGPGDWRTDRTSTFPASSVPVVPASPAPGPERRDDSDFHPRPTSIRPQPPAPGAIPRQPGRGETGGAGPINLPDRPSQAAGAGWAGRADQGASQPRGDMPDWRLAPPAWSPPAPMTPGEPAAGPSAPDAAPAGEAAPAKAPEQKRRGLFRRKNKSEPAPVAEAAESGWVEVPSATGSDSDQPTTGDPTLRGPRGFGFGSLVTSRFGDGDGQADDPMANKRSDRDPVRSGPDPWPRDLDTRGRDHVADGLAARDSSARDLDARDSGTRDLGAGLGAANRSRSSWDSAGAGRHDQPTAEPGTSGAGRGSWDPASGTHEAPADAGTADQDRGIGRKAGRAQRHLRSVDLGSDSDDGSWDVDVTPARGTQAKEDDADGSETAGPSRGLFRRNRDNNAETAESRSDPAADAAPDQPRGKRGKGDKPIRERDEEYVDWVAGLSAPEPVNERRRDETPRRSLRSTTPQKDE